MNVKHQPATPLPWIAHSGTIVTGGNPSFAVADYAMDRSTDGNPRVDDQVNAAYSLHAANAYPKLVEACRGIVACGDYIGPGANARNAQGAARALLRELGEEA